jgi:3',5'-cyclic AMP phosphodiesterase CpdA
LSITCLVSKKVRENKLRFSGFVVLACIFLSSCSHQNEILNNQRSGQPLTVIAIGDAGKAGSELRSNAQLLTNMYTGQHDGGKFDAMIFLGDNFYNTGLNVPADEVSDYIKRVLGPFKVPFEGLGRNNIHAVTGNHDYYARNAFETSLLFGLVTIAEGPIGLTGKGNQREEAIQSWTYHYNMPSSVTYALPPGGSDSVQFLFVDSALPLRTDQKTWSMALDSLRSLMRVSAAKSGVTWRILCMHQPIYTVGEHGGYSVWNDETNTVGYLTPCDKDSNAVSWLKNSFDPEDPCTEKYSAFIDSVKTVIKRSNIRIQLALAGHDHSLQLLYYPEKDGDCQGCPKIHIVSGAGSKPARVKFPHPPFEFTSAQRQPSKEGVSVPGFAQLTFEKEKVRVVFFDGSSIAPYDMGDGKKEFWISSDGRLLDK